MHYKYTDIKAIVAEILENKKDEGGIKNIYFVGCGGSLGALYPPSSALPATRATPPKPLPLQSWARRWAPLSSS